MKRLTLDNYSCFKSLRRFRGKIRFYEPLKKHTTFRIGGPVDCFLEPKDISDLKLLLNLLKRYKIFFRVIGLGSNILASDKSIKITVIHLGAPDFKKISIKGRFIEAGAGCALSQFVSVAQKHGLSGCEFLTGIPGTLGGALIMNAGQAKDGLSLADLVESVKIIDYNNKIRVLSRNDLKFGYRRSNLGKYIILNARLKLVKSSQSQVKKQIDAYLKSRRLTQGKASLSAGCIFKNPLGDSAGRLIDLCKLKGKRCADAYISRKHANFILNRSNASAEDVFRLIELVQKQVKNKFRINLKPEVKIWK